MLCAAQVDTTLSELVRDLGTRTDATAESDLRLPMKTKMDMYGAASLTVFMTGFGPDPNLTCRDGNREFGSWSAE